VAEGTIAFVLRELTDPQGGFYSALDADSEGVEGKYYVWTDAELARVLSAEELAVCRVLYGTGGEPNFEDAHVLEMQRTPDEAAKLLKIPSVELERQAAEVRRKLLAARQKRVPPARDDKVLASWNGLMIRALARAGVILERPEYIRAAEKAAEFVLAEMRDEQGRLYRTWRAKQAKLNAYLDDYADVVEGLLALHLATGDEKWANAARRLTDRQLALFWDEQGKGCYFTAHDHESLLARTKNAYDSVLPSGNSVTARNLLRLSSISRQSDYRDKARECLELFVPLIADSPLGLTNMALALAEYLDTTAAAPEQGARGPARTRLGIAPDAAVFLAEGRKEEPPKAGKKAAKKKPDEVSAKAFLSVDRLPAGSTCLVLVQLQIVEGWHIHANPAGDGEDLPTELTVDSSLGSELTKIRYPKGKTMARPEPISDDQPPMSIYSGQVAIVGTLEVPADIAGQQEELTISVRYQACNDKQCVVPKTLKLTVPVVVAKRGEAVKAVNEKLFAPAAPPRKK
jgi:uncharacterized protein YyaL (SSP411 family)